MSSPSQTLPANLRIDQQVFSATLLDALARGEAVLLRVHGGSMKPWLREEQKIRVSPVAGRRIRRGDVALFRRENGRMILHRVVRVGRDPQTDLPLYGCLGDAEAGMPELVPEAALLGVVDLGVFRRWAFLALEPSRRFINRVLSKMGIRLRHG
jgi:hypothetical protein